MWRIGRERAGHGCAASRPAGVDRPIHLDPPVARGRSQRGAGIDNAFGVGSMVADGETANPRAAPSGAHALGGGFQYRATSPLGAQHVESRFVMDGHGGASPSVTERVPLAGAHSVPPPSREELRNIPARRCGHGFLAAADGLLPHSGAHALCGGALQPWRMEGNHPPSRNGSPWQVPIPCHLPRWRS